MTRGVSRMARGVAGLVVLAPLLAAFSCDPTSYPDQVRLYDLSGAPPAREAELFNDFDGEGADNRITLSRGVALAVTCRESCEGGCVAPTFIVEDATLLAVQPADSGAYRYGEAYVLTALAEGTTTLRVETACAASSYRVQVVAPD